MTLQVPSVLGLGRSEVDDAHQAWDSYEACCAQLTMWGFTPPARPMFPCPDINPNTYTQLEGAQYSILMGQVDAWFAYTNGMIAMISGRLVAIQNEKKMIGVDLRQNIRRRVAANEMKKPTEAELNDMLLEQPRYRELTKYEQDFDITKKHLDAISEGLERHAKGLSRQVTLRGQEIELTGMNAGKRGGRQMSG